MEDLKLKEIYARNYKGFDKIKVSFSNRDHIDIIGPNGSGKTSLKEVIQVCCAGISKKGSNGELVGERFRYIGKHGPTADVISVFEDVKGGFTVTIANHITKTSNAISITASDGRALTKEWLREFFNFAFMSAESFLSHTPKEQCLLLGINTSKYDAKINEIKAAYTIINRKLKGLGAVEHVEKVEPVDVHELYEERDRIREFNDAQKNIAVERNELNNEIKGIEGNIKQVKSALARYEADLKEVKKILGEMPQPGEAKDEQDIQVKIDAADEINDKATAYQEVLKKVDEQESIEKELETNREERTKVAEDRLAYIKGFKLPFKGLSVDEDGGLLLNDRRLNSYSTGEQINIIAKLLNSQNPLNKTVWIDEFERLDPDHKKKVAYGLIKQGYRVITSEVGTKKKSKGSILLEGCAIVGDDIAKEEDDRPTIL